ncbi:MAG: hypothetical protein ACOYBR_09760 [Fluviibacter sp.]
MTLQEWLFNGGDPKLPAVRFVDVFGGGCGFCAFYRALLLAAVMAGGWIFGWRGAVAVALAGAVAFVALHAYAASLPLDQDEYPHEKF